MFLLENLSFWEIQVYNQSISQKKEVDIMREELFKMERKGLVVEGQEVDVTERVKKEKRKLVFLLDLVLVNVIALN